ncbi:hypothetical protein KIF59_13765 [Enterobacter cloacae subsp. cloacae]|nr:hypothetical protein [Enterobacter cloacae subsp. cloacae]
MSIRYSDNTPGQQICQWPMPHWYWRAPAKSPLGALREIWGSSRARRLPVYPLMQLGMALKLMGMPWRSQQALDLAPQTPRNDSRNWMADYGSALRDNALMLPSGGIQAAAGCAK